MSCGNRADGRAGEVTSSLENFKIPRLQCYLLTTTVHATLGACVALMR